MTHFEASIAIGTPNSDAHLLGQARLRHQLEQLDLSPASTPRQFLPRPPAEAHPVWVTSEASCPTNPTITVRQLSCYHLGNACAATPSNTSAAPNHSMLTSGPYQYTAFCVDERTLRIVQRDLSSGTLIAYELSGPYHAHQPPGRITLAIDREGYLHLTYTEQNSHLAYRRSVMPNSITGWTEHLDLSEPDHAAVTSHSFILPDTSQPDRPLMLVYDVGPSDDRSARISAYDEKTRCWIQRPAPILSVSVENRRPVHIRWSDPVTGTDGSLHLAVVFHGQGPAPYALLDEVSVGYAKSTDDGLTWHASTGRPYELPITPLNAEIVHTLSRDCLSITEPRIALDSRNRPHITFCTDRSSGCGQYGHIWFDGLAWRHQSAPAFQIASQHNPDSRARHPVSPPETLIDSHDTIYVLYDGTGIDGTQSVMALVAPDYIFDPSLVNATCDASLPFNTRSIDRTRWTRDAILSMLVQYAARPNVSVQVAPTTALLLLVDAQLSAIPFETDASGFRPASAAPPSAPM